MKIELKSIKVNLAFSEETTMFKADIFVDGKKVAYAQNDGRGGCTHINSYEGKREKLREAEEFALTLPPHILTYGGEDHEIKSDLELMVDTMVEDFIGKREADKFNKKRAKAMEKKIVWGVPNGDSFDAWGLKSPLTIKQLLDMPNGRDALKKLFTKVKAELKDGEEIFNKELVELFDGVKS